MLSATRKVEIRKRSIGLPLLPELSQANRYSRREQEKSTQGQGQIIRRLRKPMIVRNSYSAKKRHNGREELAVSLQWSVRRSERQKRLPGRLEARETGL